MNRLIIFLLGIIAGGALCTAGAQTNAEWERYQEGIRLMDKKRYADAILHFEAVRNVLTKDCNEKIEECKKKIAHIKLKIDDRYINEKTPIYFNCNQCDTIVTLESNNKYKVTVEDYSSGIREAKVSGNKLYISFDQINKSMIEKHESIKISAGEAPNKHELAIELIHKRHPAYIDCKSKNLNLPAEGTTRVLKVDSNTEWMVETSDIETSDAWVNIEQDSSSININVIENSNTTERNTHFIIKSKYDQNINITINIKQLAGNENLSIENGDLKFSANGNVEYVLVQSNDKNWSVKDYPADWCIASRVPGTDSLRIESFENVSGITRKATVQISTATGNKTAGIVIEQPSNEFVPKYAFSKILEGRNLSFGVKAGGNLSIVQATAAGNFCGSMVNYGLGNGTEEAAYNNSIGLSFGLIADIRLYRNLYLKTGLDYTRIRYSNEFSGDVSIMATSEPNVSYFKGVSKNSYKEEYTFDFIEVPLLLSYRFVINRSSCIHLDLGPYISYGISAEMEWAGTTSANMGKYKITGGVLTNEKVNESEYIRQYKRNAHIDLYDKKVKTTTVHTFGANEKFYEVYNFKEAPFNRLNCGLQIGVIYEYGGFCAGLNYKHMFTNMANKKFWESERMEVFNTTIETEEEISGYKQHLSSLSITLSYIFRYKKQNNIINF